MSAVTSGLKTKEILSKNIYHKCPKCKGTGNGGITTIDAKNIKNKNMTGKIDLSDDCPVCQGNGKVTAIIRKAIKKPKTTAPIVLTA